MCKIICFPSGHCAGTVRAPRGHRAGTVLNSKRGGRNHMFTNEFGSHFFCIVFRRLLYKRRTLGVVLNLAMALNAGRGSVRGNGSSMGVTDLKSTVHVQ